MTTVWWRRVYPPVADPEFTFEDTPQGRLATCTDCGKVSLNLPSGPRNRHHDTCPRLPYLLYPERYAVRYEIEKR
jgi:hypothetical protein